MIPIKLHLQGFLSYREAAELDFTGFDLACISGENGAGKSSLLDAITWALFGQARKNDEALLNAASDAAEVAFTFAYEGNVYKIQRSKQRGKSTLLEFQIQQADQSWRPLTERSVRETQARIQQILHLDYETFVNASFFLQGKADQFTQQKPADRKRVLANILGLEAWEAYKERTAERRKRIEADLAGVDGRVSEIDAELDEEPARTKKLSELETQLARAGEQRKAQETIVENMRRVAASLNDQRRLVESLHAQARRAAGAFSTLEMRLTERRAERDAQAGLLARAAEIDSAYRAWTKSRSALEQWEQTAAQFRDAEQKRQPFLLEIESEKARLSQEQETLIEKESAISEQLPVIRELHSAIENLRERASGIEITLQKKEEKEAEQENLRMALAALNAENDRLKTEMNVLKERVDTLETTDGAVCPLCGQPLDADERARLIDQLKAEGKEKGDAHRANSAQAKELAQSAAEFEKQFKAFAIQENERVSVTAQISQQETTLNAIRAALEAWEKNEAPRLKTITAQLGQDAYAAKARASLASVDRDLSALGYDAAAHDEARRTEQSGRSAEADQRELEKARAALAPLEREIVDIEKEIKAAHQEAGTRQKEYEAAAATLSASEQQAPDVNRAESALFDLQEHENQLNQEVGAARQKVIVLDDLRARKITYETQREELGRDIGRHKTLERAFGKDGVPALLIEQSLPQIEEKANALLERLANGSMSVRFVTQADYKDKQREDKKETLDIQISDSAGTRDYEMFSGGEAFRVNFAIRLALSELLAQRTGARLQTLVIDEGFGSQDAQGRQRLIEAINSVQADFAKVLIITHLEELKEAFPNRIEVEKTASGSTVRVI
jgi:exonuclease SbcC